jgi:hypothetical protein
MCTSSFDAQQLASVAHILSGLSLRFGKHGTKSAEKSRSGGVWDGRLDHCVSTSSRQEAKIRRDGV